VPKPAPVSKGAGEAAEGEEVTFEITVPESVKPGDKLAATTPSGVRVKLSVPEGAEPGTILTFALPANVGASDRESKAAIMIQARVRGAKTRQSTVRAVQLEVDPEVLKAATKLQSTFRGHTTRNEQQEASRLQWMKYYMQPAVAEWEEALSLAVTPEEERKIHEARAASTEEGQERAKLFAHYLARGNYGKAADYATTPSDMARLLKAKVLAALGPCACCIGDKKVLERERSELFITSIRTYEWEVAEISPRAARRRRMWPTPSCVCS